MNAASRFDLHVHSLFSPDSSAELGQVVEQLPLSGLQGFALTDHNSLRGYARLRELQERFPRYLMIPGVEVSTLDGHLLVYSVDALPPLHRPLTETLEWVDAHQGVAVLAHPFRFFHGVGEKLAGSARVTAMETVNGHSSLVANERAELVAARRGLGQTGGSDSHNLSELGRAYTMFPDGVRTVDDILEAIRRGRCHSAGRSVVGAERWRLAFSTVGRRVARGFRPV